MWMYDPNVAQKNRDTKNGIVGTPEQRKAYHERQSQRQLEAQRQAYTERKEKERKK